MNKKVETTVNEVANYFTSLFSEWDVFIDGYGMKKMKKSMRNSVELYFEGVKSPHGLSSEADNYACDVVEVLEDYLDIIDCTIPSDDREGGEDESRLYGSEYYAVCDDVAEILRVNKEETK